MKVYTIVLVISGNRPLVWAFNDKASAVDFAAKQVASKLEHIPEVKSELEAYGSCGPDCFRAYLQSARVSL